MGRGSPAQSLVKQRYLVFAATAVGVGLLRASLMVWQSPFGLPWYAMVLQALAVIALATGALALMRFYAARRSATFLLVGAGLAMLGGLEGVGLAMTVWRGPADTPWQIGTRLFAASLLSLRCFAWWRRDPTPGAPAEVAATPRPIPAGRVYAAVTCLAAGTMLLPWVWPGTAGVHPIGPLARPEELPAALLLGGLVTAHLHRGLWRHDAFEAWLVSALLLLFGSQTLFMPFAGTLADPLYGVAQGLRVAACLAIAGGLLGSSFRLFRQAEADARDKALANQQLQAEVEWRQARERQLQAEGLLRGAVWTLPAGSGVEEVLAAFGRALVVLELPMGRWCLGVPAADGTSWQMADSRHPSGWSPASPTETACLLALHAQGQPGAWRFAEVGGPAAQAAAVDPATDGFALPFAGGVLAVQPRHAAGWTAAQTTSLQGLLAVLAEGLRRQADLAQRERAEAELRLLALVVSRTDNAVVISDPQGIVEWVNEGYTRLLGVAPDQARGRDLAGAVLGSRPASVLQLPARLAPGESHQAQVAVRAHSGRTFRAEIHVQPIVDDRGQTIHLLAIERDVTDRWLADEALRHLTVMQQAILDSASYSIVATDRSGTIVTFNAAAERLLGYAASEVIGQQSLDFACDAAEIHDRAVTLTEELGRPVAAGFEALVARVASCEVGSDEHEWTCVSRDGRRFPMLLAVTALRDRQHEVTGYLSIGSDITERRRADAELREARDLAEAANRAKSQFIASVSHELRTPLNAIIGYSELLQEELAELNAAEMSEDLARIRLAGRHLLTLINDILDLSKIEAGRMELDLQAFALADLVDEVTGMVQPLVAKGRNQLDVDMAAEVGGMFADPTKVRQVLYNLLANAAKFTEQGSISLQVQPVDFAGDPWVDIRVRDTGIGMSAVQLAGVFEPFRQADTSTSRRFGGTGLGLAISQRYCALMGGRITVTSSLGVGSEFRVLLPGVVQAAPAGAPARPAELPLVEP
jgi:PAS domain S-box-containing protein